VVSVGSGVGGAGEIDAMGIVDQALEDGVGVGGSGSG
jgi:hypothetical protein